MSSVRILSLFILLCTSYIYTQKPIHVLCVMNTFFSDTKTVIANQILGLKEKGFRVSILAKKKPIQVNKELEAYFEKDTQWGTLEGYDLRSIDVILCQYGSLGKECATYLRSKKGPKLITFFRGSDITTTSETMPGSYDLLFSVGDLFLPVCAYYTYLLTILGCDSSKILVQPSGINCKMFNFRKNLPTKNEVIRIISVSRLAGQKGLDTTIRAIALLVKEGYNIEYTIVGDGTKKNYLTSLAQELHIADRIHMVGHQPNKKVADLLQKSHIFILPSVTSPDGTQEGIPNALKEAMATGLPVISTYHAGIRELITHDYSGLLIPERDVMALVKNIKYLIRNPDKWDLFIRAARNTVESMYDVDALNDLLAQRIISLVQSKTLEL